MKNLLKNKILLLVAGLLVLLIGVGIVIYKAVFAPAPATPVTTQDTGTQNETLPAVDSSISVAVTSASAANTVTLSVKGLASKYTSLSYEFSYQSQGLVKGVNSGSKPIDVSGKDAFSRDIYLGTCSKNDCKPDVGVTKVTVNLVFTDTSGKQSQFSQDFNL